MIKKILFIFILSAVIQAQDRVDSILTANHNKTLAEQIVLLNDFCWKNRDIDPPLAVKAAEIALSFAEKIDDKHNKSKALNYLSVIYRDQGEYEKSLSLAARGMEVAHDFGDKTEEAYSFNNISTIYRLMGNYPAAIEKLYKALEIFESVKDTVGIGYCYYNLGFVYMKWENYEKALLNFETTVKLRDKLGDSDGKTKAQGRIAEIYLHEGKNEEARKIFTELEKSFSELKDQRGLINIRMGLAELYKRNKDYSNAINERLLALKISERIQDASGIVTNASELGVLYALIGQFKLGNDYLQKGQNLAEKYNSSALRLTNYKSFTEFFELQQDYANAYKYAKLFRQQQDSVYRKEKSTAMNEVEASYEINKREKEKELLKRDIEDQQNKITYIVLISLLSLGIAAFAIVLYFFKRRTSEKLKELNATKDKFFGIIAHDLKNPITAQFGLTSLLIEDFTVMSDVEKLELIKAIDKTGKQTFRLLENLLLWARSQTGRIEFNPSKISLDELALENFVLLEEHAKMKEITLERDFEKNTTALGDQEMIKTVIRNMLSNAIKFTAKGGRVILKISSEKDFKVVSITDTGVGIPAKYLNSLFKIDAVASTPGTSGEKGTGLGLVLCKEFVEKNGGKIWVKSELEKGTTFSFSIPNAS